MTESHCSTDTSTLILDRESYADCLKRCANRAYLMFDNSRSSRRSMRHKLRGTYEFIAKETTPDRWASDLNGNPEAQERLALTICAMADDIATGTLMLSPNSALRTLMRELYPEHDAPEND